MTKFGIMAFLCSRKREYENAHTILRAMLRRQPVVTGLAIRAATR
jgi:hypothetical protein